MQFQVTQEVLVIVAVKDETVFERGQDPAWAASFYGPMNRTRMVEHFAQNAVANGIEDASRLEGFADLAPGAVTMEIRGTATDVVRDVVA